MLLQGRLGIEGSIAEVASKDRSMIERVPTVLLQSCIAIEIAIALYTSHDDRSVADAARHWDLWRRYIEFGAESQRASRSEMPIM